jgi:hypothetical protein
VKSNGHLRECVRPKEQAEESAHVAKLESDLANALLQLKELQMNDDGIERGQQKILDLEEELSIRARTIQEMGLQIEEIHRVNALCGEMLKKEIDETRQAVQDVYGRLVNMMDPDVGWQMELSERLESILGKSLKRKDETVADMADAEPTGANQHARSGLCWCSLFHDMG